MQSFIRFAKSSGTYFVGNILIRLVSVVLIPIYTRYISPSDFGQYDLSIAYVTFIASILYLDIWNGIMRFMFDYPSPLEKHKAITNGGMIFILSTLFYTALFCVAGAVTHIEYLGYIYLYGLLMNAQNLFSYIARGFGKSIIFVLAGLVGSVVTLVTNIVLIVGLGWNYRALYAAACIGYVFNIGILLCHRELKLKYLLSSFDRNIFIKMFKFSLPLCVNSVAYWFLTSYNRVVISDRLGLVDNGYFALAGKIAVVLTIFTSCFQLAWQEMTFAQDTSDEAASSRFYSKAVNLYVKFLSIGALIIIPGVAIAFPFFVDAKYAGSKFILPLYIIATIASSFSAFLGSVFGTIKKTTGILLTTIVACLVNIVIIQLMISRWGLQTANISLLAGFLVNIVLRLIILRRHIKIKLNYVPILIYTCLFVAAIVIYNNLGVVYNVAGLFAFILLFLFSFREYIITIVQKIKQSVWKV
jgi:O-antigen/teichoic acid export membrane protein